MQPSKAHLNAIGTAVPANEVHGLFTDYAPRLFSDPRARRLFGRMAERCGIDYRYSVLVPSARPGQLDDAGLYREGAFAGAPADAIEHWAVHPGGRSVLDAVARALELAPETIATSRGVLRRYGNMSSPTVLFVLKEMLARRIRGPGCASAFGAGLAIESLMFEGLG